jgi:signal peptidase I
MSENTSPTTEAPKRRWVGVLLSLFVPGFGLVRAGHIWRGVAWFLAVQVIGVLAVLLAIWRSIPFWGVLAGLVIALGCQLAMLVDSFRPGRLNARLWLIFVVALLAIMFLRSRVHLFAHAFTMPTDGMAPTLRGRSHGTGDCVIADRLCYMLSPPKRGELVVFRTTGIAEIRADTFFVQRLVGLPGEKIDIHDGHVFADGRQLGESDGIPDIHYTTGPARPFMAKYEVPQDAYFMLGDNSPNSFDSRYWGYLPASNVYARVSRIYYPFSRVSVPR